jgi:spermidine synthase
MSKLLNTLPLPKTLFETESPISGKIRVIQDGNERRLVVGGLTQSINFDAPDVNERIWGRMVEQIRNSKHEIRNCLVLGLGGGTVAHLLTQKFGPIPIDGVEIDPTIVEIGKKFFDLDKLSNLNIITGDAINLVHVQQWNKVSSLRSERSASGGSNTMKQYDLIIVDLYRGGEYPDTAESRAFLAGLTKLTDPQGLIVFNRISTEKDLEFEEKLTKAFGGFRKKIVPSKFGGENLIYTCSPTPAKQSKAARR